MKKVLTSLFFLLIASICFSLPNIKLYNEGEFVCQIDNDNVYDENNKLTGNIRDGKIYDAEKNEYACTILEQDDRLILNNDYETYEYSKANGYVLIKKFYAKLRRLSCNWHADFPLGACQLPPIEFRF